MTFCEYSGLGKIPAHARLGFVIGGAGSSLHVCGCANLVESASFGSLYAKLSCGICMFFFERKLFLNAQYLVILRVIHCHHVLVIV